MARGVGGFGGFGGFGGGGGRWAFYGQGGPDPWPPLGPDGRPMEGLLQRRRHLEQNNGQSLAGGSGAPGLQAMGGQLPGARGILAGGRRNRTTAMQVQFPGMRGGLNPMRAQLQGAGGFPVGGRMNQLQAQLQGAGGSFAGGRRARMAAQLAALGIQQQGAGGAKEEGEKDK